uniref:Uncharacterized protein n=1 Tax=Trichogramma kaykai TaxID=54128 RepID=A0ABD2X966_9HYME
MAAFPTLSCYYYKHELRRREALSQSNASQSALVKMDHKVHYPVLFTHDSPNLVLNIKGLSGNFKEHHIQEFLKPIDPSKYTLTAVKPNPTSKWTAGKINCASLLVSCKIQTFAAANMFKWSFVNSRGKKHQGYLRVVPEGDKNFHSSCIIIKPPTHYSPQTLACPFVSDYPTTIQLFKRMDIRTAFNSVLAFSLHSTLVDALFTYYFDSSRPIDFGQTSFKRILDSFDKYSPHTLIFNTPNDFNSVLLVKKCLQKMYESSPGRRVGERSRLRRLDVTAVEMNQQCVEFIFDKYEIDSFSLGTTLSPVDKILCKANIKCLKVINNIKFRGECLANSALREVVIENCANLRLELVGKALVNNFSLITLDIINSYATDFHVGNVSLFEQIFSNSNTLEQVAIKFKRPDIRLEIADFNPQIHMSPKIKYLDLSNAMFVKSVIHLIIPRIPNVSILKLENIHRNEHVDFS